MDEGLPIEQKIARYLEANDITIVPETRPDGTEVLGFVQHYGRQMRVLGEILFDGKTGIVKGADADNLRQSLQLPRFVTEVRRPLARLLRQVSGDFYADILEPIHDACDRVEAKYAGR
jgi:hypothetical protein